MKRIVLAALLALAPAFALAQSPVTHTDRASNQGVIAQVDPVAHTVVVGFSDGTTQTLNVPPGMNQFDTVKPGDRVSFDTNSSVIYAIQPPGTTPPPDGHTTVALPAPQIGVTITDTKSSVVTVQAVDASISNITVQRANGTVATYNVADGRSLKKVNVGDRISITYQDSVTVKVTPTK